MGSEHECSNPEAGNPRGKNIDGSASGSPPSKSAGKKRKQDDSDEEEGEA
jgi:hypothetical protein